jgi:bifunctional non-homologous end joining protein LigD
MGVKAPLPGFIEPALATSIEKVPSRAKWIHEIKFDDRVQFHLANEAIKIFTRRGHDWTHRFKKVSHDAWHIKAGSAIIDGEIVVPAADGSTDFSVLQNEMKGRSKSIILVAFDLLHLNGPDIRKEPLLKRKAELKKIIAGPTSSSAKASKSTARKCSPTPARSVSKGWCRRCGTASIRPDAATTGSRRPARSARPSRSLASRSTAASGTDFTSAGARAAISSTPAKWTMASTRPPPRTCASGLSVRKTQAFSKRVAHKGIWVEPKLKGEIEYRAKSAEGKVRHPFFKGLREDL